MPTLAQVKNFGGIDADADLLLEACFQDHEAYTDALRHQRWLIIGRKGSGKTAIFKKFIKTREPLVFSLGHTFSDYPWNHHKLQATLGVPEEQRFTHSWTYLILLTLSKVLLNQDNSQPWSEASSDQLIALESFVVDSYGTRDPDVSQLFTPAKRLRIEPHLKIGEYLDVGLRMDELPVSELPRMFQEVNRRLLGAVTDSLNPAIDYYVCFDELDIGFNPASPEYVQMLTGLILAARIVNVAAREKGKKMSVVVFLRNDIYGLLRFEDKNKITENHSSLIEWDREDGRWTLKGLMERRFGEVLERGEVTAWDEVFDETKEMPGRQTKYKHILDRTFRRPRDIIKFCNEILGCYRARGPDELEKLSNEDISQARRSYSDYLLRELEDEIPKHVPRYDDYLEVLKAIGLWQFRKDQFEEEFSEKIGGADINPTSEEALKQLFEFSIIGFQKTGGAGGGSEYVWKYLDQRLRFDGTAVNFRVHPGLIEVLGLKR